MNKVVGKIEEYISYALIWVGLTYAAYQTIELVYRFLTRLWDALSSTEFLTEAPGRPVGSLFFSVLLTLELIATVRVFAEDHLIKIRVILLVGLIAVTRKILEMDMAHMGELEAYAVAALILALSISYFLVSRTEKGSVDGHTKKLVKD
jgi:uncharacterized membrane protein (DUF373 family)